MVIDYRTEKFQKVSVCGIPCDFSDMRIDRSTVPEGRYQYEVADDDESQGEPSRIHVRLRVTQDALDSCIPKENFYEVS